MVNTLSFIELLYFIEQLVRYLIEQLVRIKKNTIVFQRSVDVPVSRENLIGTK